MVEMNTLTNPTFPEVNQIIRRLKLIAVGKYVTR